MTSVFHPQIVFKLDPWTLDPMKQSCRSVFLDNLLHDHYLTWRSHICWHPHLSLAWSPSLSGAPYYWRCWGSGRTEAPLWSQSNGYCCPPANTLKQRKHPLKKPTYCHFKGWNYDGSTHFTLYRTFTSTISIDPVSLYLSTEVDHVCVCIIIWQQHSITCVQLQKCNRLFKICLWGELKWCCSVHVYFCTFWYHEQHVKFWIVRYWVPESEFPLTHPGESCGEDVSVSGEDGSHWPDPVVWSKALLLVSGGTHVTTRTRSCFR